MTFEQTVWVGFVLSHTKFGLWSEVSSKFFSAKETWISSFFGHFKHFWKFQIFYIGTQLHIFFFLNKHNRKTQIYHIVFSCGDKFIRWIFLARRSWKSSFFSIFGQFLVSLLKVLKNPFFPWHWKQSQNINLIHYVWWEKTENGLLSFLSIWSFIDRK